jgi:hypothetical protein
MNPLVGKRKRGDVDAEGELKLYRKKGKAVGVNYS